MRDIINLGVIVGRFQVHRLHEGHRYLIEHVIRNREYVLILVGSTGGFPTKRNPLDFETRKKMIEAEYPMVVVKEIKDAPKNVTWSNRVDSIIEDTFDKPSSVTLFGSRDSFISSYEGKYKTEEIAPIPAKCGEEIRNEIYSSDEVDSQSFREGMIFAQSCRLPVSYQVVDTVVVFPNNKILLGRKKIDLDKYRFIGGFVEPTHTSLEHALKCEIMEELSYMETSAPIYIGSGRINDHRYRNSEDGIMTAFYVCSYIFGQIKASDDLDEVAIFDFEEVENVLIDSHKSLWLTYKEKIKQSIS